MLLHVGCIRFPRIFACGFVVARDWIESLAINNRQGGSAGVQLDERNLLSVDDLWESSFIGWGLLSGVWDPRAESQTAPVARDGVSSGPHRLAAFPHSPRFFSLSFLEYNRNDIVDLGQISPPHMTRWTAAALYVPSVRSDWRRSHFFAQFFLLFPPAPLRLGLPFYAKAIERKKSECGGGVPKDVYAAAAGCIISIFFKIVSLVGREGQGSATGFFLSRSASARLTVFAASFNLIAAPFSP